MFKMRRRVPAIRSDAAPGSSPGTLVSSPDSVPSRVTVFSYDGSDLVEREITELDELAAIRMKHRVTWVNVDGLGTLDVLRKLGELFGLHDLALEDVLNIPQRPKVDAYGDHQFIVLRMPISRETVVSEQFSLFLGADFLISFQEKPGDCLDPVRKRLREGRPRIRSGGPDYLAYALLDAIVDAYFPLLETIGSRLDELEFDIVDNSEKGQIHELYNLKRGLVSLRRYVWPLREVMSQMVREENPVVSEKTRVYLRDCYDHSIQALDLIESYRDIASGLVDLYLSIMSQKMNEVMKVLTIIATVFIPLSFIAGLYGMNFDPEASRWNMPELGLPFGYPLVLGFMLLCGGGMLYYFWRKGWFR